MSFPRDHAQTQGFSLGRPNQPTVSSDGSRVVFTRTGGGHDRRRCLWAYDVAARTERLIVDPGTLVDQDAAISAEERARRERTRDRSAGVSAYATDAAASTAAFALSGRLWLADLDAGAVRELPATAPVIDPRPNPQGTAIAYVCAGTLRVVGADGTGDRALAEPDGPEVSYGLAEHEAAESMHRMRGYWWAPEGDRLAVARVDNAQVQTWYIADPTQPTAQPIALRYPPAGSPNADVSIWIMTLDGARTEVQWDREAFEYVTEVVWDRAGLLVAVQNRAQSRLRLLRVDPATGATEVVREDTDPCWVELVPGVPARTSTGALVWTADIEDTRHLTVDGAPVTPAGLQVRDVAAVDGETVLFTASTEPADIRLWAWTPAGLTCLSDHPGRYDGTRSGGTTVISGWDLEHAGATVTVHAAGHEPYELASYAATPPLTPRVTFLRAGERELRTAVLYPTGHEPGSGMLPVLMDPYGGTAAQRVVYAQSMYLVSQWFADQGFIVVVADGRGTPGRGPRWDKSIYRGGDDMRVEDQVEALHAAAREHPDMDLSRVGIRGWSAGGTLAARAVLTRPDVFHAAVAGAPVTDERLYSSHWEERYNGLLDEHPEAYELSDLVRLAPQLRRPLMLIHGMLDDNVHPVHTMRLSAALLAAGRPHTVLPLPGASHMTSTVDTTANLLVVQAAYLRDSLNPVRELS